MRFNICNRNVILVYPILDEFEDRLFLRISQWQAVCRIINSLKTQRMQVLVVWELIPKWVIVAIDTTVPSSAITLKHVLSNAPITTYAIVNRSYKGICSEVVS